MKISRKTRWALSITIMVILLITMGVVYRHHRAEQRELSAELARAQKTFMKYNEPLDMHTEERKELEARFDKANSQIASAQKEYRKPTESIEINETLFAIAHPINVTITGLSSSPPKKEEINGIAYQAFSLSLTATGELQNLLNFNNKIGESFPTATIGSVSIGEGAKSLTLQMKIYAYGT